MFSINIDKLVNMTHDEEIVYEQIAEKIIEKGTRFKSIAVIDNNIVAFKVAESIRKADNKVLFVDADFSNSVFLGKYKLGKELKGVCDYLSGNELPKNIICYTNKDNLNVVFTGDAETHAMLTLNEAEFSSLLSLYKNDYDYVVVNVNDNLDAAKNCDGTVLVMEDADYSEKKARKEVQNLDDAGCFNLGVIVNNVRK